MSGVQTYGIPTPSSNNSNSGGFGGSDIISTVIGGWMAGRGARRQRRWDAQQAQIARDWQERMSNTAVQRRMADMAAAGVNPVLAARFDATTPPGAMAHSAPNIGGAAVSGAQNATQIKTMQESLKILRSQRENIDQDTQLKRDQAFHEWARAVKTQGVDTQVAYAVRKLNLSQHDRNTLLNRIDNITLAQRKWLYQTLDNNKLNYNNKVNTIMKEFGVKQSVAIGIMRMFNPDLYDNDRNQWNKGGWR